MADLARDGPKAKLFPLFYKQSAGKDLAVTDGAQSEPPAKTRTKKQTRPSGTKSSENVGQRRKTKAGAARSAFQKADSESKITALFSRAPVRANSPMPLSPTSLNHDSPVEVDAEDPIVPTSLAAAAAPRSEKRAADTVVDDSDDHEQSAQHSPARQPPPVDAPSTGTRAVPIEIPDSPDKSKPAPSLFVPRNKIAAVGVPRRKQEPLPPSWPDAGMQHVRGGQTSLRVLKQPPRIASSRPTPHDANDAAFLHDWIAVTGDGFQLPRRFSTLTERPSPADIALEPALLQGHPALVRVLPSSTSSAGLSWNDLYRPTSADHVLGNEHHARYLKSWLQALQLQLETGVFDAAKAEANIKLKRPAVIRAVNPKRKRRRTSEESDVDDWIVSDDDTDVAQRGSDDDYAPPPVIRRDRDVAGGDEVAFEKLTNVIVLSGPSGVGKSAAAHACAVELDWSVFEIYPGIGKRSGANIMSLVGDAAHNHLLHLGRSVDVSGPDDAVQAARPISLDSPTPEPVDRSAGSRTVRQSLFLFDEVDVLFRDDANFWPTLVNLVADSRRPVILTCNDISLVPLRELPIQVILQFQPPQPDLARAYLQRLAVANGIYLDRHTALSLYNPENPTRHHRPHGDLRQSINSLQFWASRTCAAAARETCDVDSRAVQSDSASQTPTGASLPSQPEEDGDVSQLWRSAETVSIYDFHDGRLIDSLEPADQPQPEDGVAGQIQLPASDTMDRLAGSGFLDRAQSMRADALGACRREYETTAAELRARGSVQPTSARMDSKTLSASQRWHQTQQAAFLDDIVPTCMLRASGREMVLDYVPRIMEMVRADDTFEQQHASATGAVNSTGVGRRMTRRRRQAQYERYVSLDTDAMMAARVVGTWAEP